MKVRICSCLTLTTWIKKEKGKKRDIFLFLVHIDICLQHCLERKEDDNFPSQLQILFFFFLVFIFLLLDSLCKWKGFCPGFILRQKSMYFTTRQSTSKNQFSVMSRQAHIQGTRAQVLGSTALNQGSLWTSETKTGPQVTGMREKTWKPDRLLRNERDRENYFPCGT